MMSKVAAYRVFSLAAVGKDLNFDQMYAGRHGQPLRQASLHRGDETKFPLAIAHKVLGVRQVTIHPEGKPCTAQAVLDIQLKASVFSRKRGMQAEQQSGEQEQAEHDPGSRRQT